MGENTFDRYSFLHFSVGAVAYYWDINLKNLIILHTLFEFLETQ